MQQTVYFTEDQRWPSRGQRYGWFIAMAIAIFIAFQLNLHLFAPLAAIPVLLLLLFLLLTVITLQQRLTVRVGTVLEGDDETSPLRRVFRRASRAAPVATAADEVSIQQVLQIDYRFKSPVSTLAPGRRGARIGRIARHIPLSDVERWYAGQVSPITPFLRAGRSFPVGFHREAVVVELAGGEKLTIPTRTQAALLEALSAAKVASVRKEQRPVRVRVREEL